MKNKKRSRAVYSLWVHWEKRIVSFHKVEGFTKMDFYSHKKMLLYAYDLSSNGYRVQ